MRVSVHHAFLVLLLAAVAPRAFSQVESQQPARIGRPQAFYFDALNFAQSDAFGLASRVDIYVQIPFDIITFIRKSDGYTGAYTLSAIINDEDGARIKEESWTRKVERTSLEGTTDPQTSDVTQKSIPLEPGSYIIEILFEDKESSTEFRSTKKIDVRKFDPNIFAMSDMMMVGSVDESGPKRRIAPHLNPNIAALTDGFTLFYEVYNPFTIASVGIEYKITRRKTTVTSTRMRQAVRQGVNTFLTRVAGPVLGVGAYELELIVTRPDDSTVVLARSSRSFVVEWLSGGTPLTITDLDEAVEQLRYFAKGDELDNIKDAPDDAERRKRFDAFWERNNPTPGSPTNRAMIEYYTRVSYANERFGHYIPGWKTDRGMVYIIYGPPSAVDRHPLDVETKPYEVWEYYDINRRFVFIDESGFGDYRLLYPIWDERNRMR